VTQCGRISLKFGRCLVFRVVFRRIVAARVCLLMHGRNISARGRAKYNTAPSLFGCLALLRVHAAAHRPGSRCVRGGNRSGLTRMCVRVRACTRASAHTQDRDRDGRLHGYCRVAQGRGAGLGAKSLLAVGERHQANARARARARSRLKRPGLFLKR